MATTILTPDSHSINYILEKPNTEVLFRSLVRLGNGRLVEATSFCPPVVSVRQRFLWEANGMHVQYEQKSGKF